MANPEMERLMHPTKKIALDKPAYEERLTSSGGMFPGISANFAFHPLVRPNDYTALTNRVDDFLKKVSQKMADELREQRVTEAKYWGVGISRLGTQNETHPKAGPYKTFGIDVSTGFIFKGGELNGEKSRYDEGTQQIALSIVKRHFKTARTGVKGMVNRLNAQYAKVPV